MTNCWFTCTFFTLVMFSFSTTGASFGTWMLSSLIGLALKFAGGLAARTVSGLVLVRSIGGFTLASSAWSNLVPAGSFRPGPLGNSTGPVFGFSTTIGLWTTGGVGSLASGVLTGGSVT